MKKQSEEIFFVQVKAPNEIRRNILEILRDIVEVLKKFEKFKLIKHQKLEKITHLRLLLKQANKMMSDLKLKLPQTSLRAVVTKEAPKLPKKQVHKKGRKKPEEKTQKREPTELERLESELNAIESKLKGLT